MTPDADIGFHSYAQSATDAARSRSIVAALSPLMEKFITLVLCLLYYYVLALWLFQLQVTTDTMNYYPAFLALQHIAGKPGTNQLVA